MHNEPGTNRDNEGMLEHKDKISKIMINRGKVGKITTRHNRQESLELYSHMQNEGRLVESTRASYVSRGLFLLL